MEPLSRIDADLLLTLVPHYLMQYQGGYGSILGIRFARAHPSPPVHSRPQVPQLIVPQGLDHVVCRSQLKARHHDIPILLW